MKRRIILILSLLALTIGCSTEPSSGLSDGESVEEFRKKLNTLGIRYIDRADARLEKRLVSALYAAKGAIETLEKIKSIVNRAAEKKNESEVAKVQGKVTLVTGTGRPSESNTGVIFHGDDELTIFISESPLSRLDKSKLSKTIFKLLRFTKGVLESKYQLKHSIAIDTADRASVFDKISDNDLNFWVSNLDRYHELQEVGALKKNFNILSVALDRPHTSYVPKNSITIDMTEPGLGAFKAFLAGDRDYFSELNRKRRR